MLPCSLPPTCTILPFNACHAPPATAPFSNPGYLLSATVLAKQPPPLKCRGPLLPPTNLARDASCSLSSAPPPPSFPPLSPIRLGVYSRRGGRRVGRTSVGNGRKGRRSRRGGRPSCSSSWVCGAEVSCSSSSPSPCSATCPPADIVTSAPIKLRASSDPPSRATLASKNRCDWLRGIAPALFLVAIPVPVPVAVLAPAHANVSSALDQRGFRLHQPPAWVGLCFWR